LVNLLSLDVPLEYTHLQNGIAELRALLSELISCRITMEGAESLLILGVVS